MHEISVNLPEMSTAILPDEQIVQNGHPTGMDLLATLLDNIEAQLKALNTNADKASREAGTPDAIRNLRRKLKKGEKGSLTVDSLVELARVLKTTPAALITPIEPLPTLRAADAQSLREYLIGQRAIIEMQRNMIDRQMEALEAQNFSQKPRKTKNR